MAVLTHCTVTIATYVDSLYCCHGDVDDCDVVDGPADVFGLVEQSLCVPHINAHLDTPEQKQQLP